MVDAMDSKSIVLKRRVGSSPTTGTIDLYKKVKSDTHYQTFFKEKYYLYIIRKRKWQKLVYLIKIFL